MVPGEMNDNDFCRVAGDKAPFVAEIADKISSVALVVGDLTVSCALERMQSSSLNLKILRNS